MTISAQNRAMNATLAVNNTLNVSNRTICLYGYGNNTLASICNNLTFSPTTGTGSNRNGSTAGLNESQTSTIIRFFLTAIIFILIVVGNSLTIHVVRNNRNLTSIKNYYYGYYIVNLSISDLLVGLVCIPTTVIYYILPNRWILGLFLCKLFPTLQVMVVSASISTLTVITFERFSAIVHPLKPRSTSKKLWLKIAATWLWSAIIALPSFVAYQINSEHQCEEKGISKWYTILLFLVNYAVPLTFIFVTYIRMLYELKSQSQTGSKREVANHRRFIKLTIILVFGFAICYLPSNIVFFILEFTVVTIDAQTITTMLQYFHLLIWFNSCLNPFIYGSVDTYFKRGFKKAFGLGSSCDSQDKTNFSGASRTFKSDRPSPAVHRWLPPESPKNQSPKLNGIQRNVRFQSSESGGHVPLLSASEEVNYNNNLQDGYNHEIPKINSRDVFIDKKGYISRNLKENNASFNITENELEENQELFVDLGSRKVTSMEIRFVNNQLCKFSPGEEFVEDLNQSKETDL